MQASMDRLALFVLDDATLTLSTANSLTVAILLQGKVHAHTNLALPP
jgi:hypothetical protein